MPASIMSDAHTLMTCACMIAHPVLSVEPGAVGGVWHIMRIVGAECRYRTCCFSGAGTKTQTCCTGTLLHRSMSPLTAHSFVPWLALVRGVMPLSFVSFNALVVSHCPCCVSRCFLCLECSLLPPLSLVVESKDAWPGDDVCMSLTCRCPRRVYVIALSWP